jgi:hypothetical protein
MQEIFYPFISFFYELSDYEEGKYGENLYFSFQKAIYTYIYLFIYLFILPIELITILFNFIYITKIFLDYTPQHYG